MNCKNIIGENKDREIPCIMKVFIRKFDVYPFTSIKSRTQKFLIFSPLRSKRFYQCAEKKSSVLIKKIVTQTFILIL